MINTIIIEDEKKISDYLGRKLREWMPEIQILDTCAEVAQSIHSIKKLKPDLVLMDIQLQGGNAFDIFKELQNSSFELIFITAFDQYALQAIKLSALDYLLKPIDESELRAALQKATNKIKAKLQNIQLSAFLQNINLARPDQKITLASSDNVEFISIKSIIRVQGDSNYSQFHIESSPPILIAKTLKEYEGILSPYQFARTHLSHLINPLHIAKYDKSRNAFVMKDNSVVPLSRVRKKEIFKKLGI